MTHTVTKWKVVVPSVALGLVFAARLVAVPIYYKATALGTLGGETVRGFSINASGQVKGWYRTERGNTSHAFLYSSGIMTDLGCCSEGHSINASGQVTGWSHNTGNRVQHAVLYSGGTMTDLGTLGGGVGGIGAYGQPPDGFFGSSEGRSINASGQITGRSGGAFLYSGGIMYDLNELVSEGLPDGAGLRDGSGINDSGQVTGQFGTGAGHAFLYSGGIITDLGTLGGSSSQGHSINASGQVTGWSDTAGDSAFHAFLYSGGIMTDLGTLGGSSSRGFSINASGQVTGWSDTAGAFLYSGGIMYDLNELVSEGPDGVFLSEARGINDSGWIIANSGSNAYLLQPVPEPASLALFAIGAGALAVLRMRYRRASRCRA